MAQRSMRHSARLRLAPASGSDVSATAYSTASVNGSPRGGTADHRGTVGECDEAGTQLSRRSSLQQDRRSRERSLCPSRRGRRRAVDQSHESLSAMPFTLFGRLRLPEIYCSAVISSNSRRAPANRIRYVNPALTGIFTRGVPDGCGYPSYADQGAGSIRNSAPSSSSVRR